MSILPYGVMVAREILVLLVWVRALVRQQKAAIEIFRLLLFVFIYILYMKIINWLFPVIAFVLAVSSCNENEAVRECLIIQNGQ